MTETDLTPLEELDLKALLALGLDRESAIEAVFARRSCAKANAVLGLSVVGAILLVLAIAKAVVDK